MSIGFPFSSNIILDSGKSKFTEPLFSLFSESNIRRRFIFSSISTKSAYSSNNAGVFSSKTSLTAVYVILLSECIIDFTTL